MYDPRVNVTLAENPDIVDRYENGHLDEQSAVMQVLAQINADDEMSDVSETGLIGQMAREALNKPDYRQRGVADEGEAVAIRTSIEETPATGPVTLHVSKHDDTIEMPQQALADQYSKVYYVDCTVVERVGARYLVEVTATGDQLGPYSPGLFKGAKF